MISQYLQILFIHSDLGQMQPSEARLSQTTQRAARAEARAALGGDATRGGA